MGRARIVDWTQDRLNGQDGYRYNEIFLSTEREEHLRSHTDMRADRQGEAYHGIWQLENGYPNIDQMIWAYAARAARRIARQSQYVTSSTLQNNGRSRYRLRLSTTHFLGIADPEEGRNLQPRIRGLWYVYTQYADIVFGPWGTTDSGFQVYPIVTFFPVSPPANQGGTAEFFEARNYDPFNQRRFG